MVKIIPTKMHEKWKREKPRCETAIRERVDSFKRKKEDVYQFSKVWRKN